MAYVYVLKAPDSAQPFYVGSTKHTLEKRLSQHRQDVRTGANKNLHFVRKAQQIGLDRVVIEPVHECADHERFILEYEVIAAMLDRGIPLTNLVRSRETYGDATRDAVDGYWATEHMLEQLGRLGDSPPTAADPSMQPIADALHAVALMLVAEIERRTGQTARAWLRDHAQA